MLFLLNDKVSYVNPSRNFSLAYIILDAIFLLFFAFYLLYKRKRMTFLFSLAGGILYFLVDFLLFYLLTGSREIRIDGEICDAFKTGAVLFWMSMSYGFLDFSFIWLWLSRDKNALEYSLLIVIWWICCPLMAQFVNAIFPTVPKIYTTRSTSKYHGVMGLIMVVGYFILILMNIHNKDDKSRQIPIIRLFIIGFLSQFLWEFLLFVFGVRGRSAENDFVDVLNTVLRDSLVETNLGMPYFYFIHKALSFRFTEELKDARKLSVEA